MGSLTGQRRLPVAMRLISGETEKPAEGAAPVENPAEIGSNKGGFARAFGLIDLSSPGIRFICFSTHPPVQLSNMCWDRDMSRSFGLLGRRARASLLQSCGLSTELKG